MDQALICGVSLKADGSNSDSWGFSGFPVKTTSLCKGLCELQ